MMAGSLLGAPLAGHGQEVREARIGFLTERFLSPPHIEALRRGLTEFGWASDGRSFRIEVRSAEGDLQRLPGLAAELAGSGVDVIVTGLGSPAALAAKRATTTVPIVFSRECRSLVGLASRFRLPAVYGTVSFPTAGA